MKITFVLPGMFVAGGVRAVLELGTEMVRLGHEVSVAVSEVERRFKPREGPVRRELRSAARALRDRLTVRREIQSWLPTEATILHVPELSARFLPAADVVIATSWETAEWVADYPASRGRKFYFVQHYETWAGAKDRVDKTYRLPLKKIVISTWLKRHFEELLGEPVLGPVIMGVRFEQFFNPTKTFHQPRVIGMMVSDIDWKGTDDGIKALGMVADHHPDIRLVYFGRTVEGSELLFPAPGRFVHRPDQADLRHLYAACDIWVSPSWHEGGGPLPCQEASACGCAIVTTDVGAVPDIYTNGENALVSPPRQPEALASNIRRLLEDDDLLRRMSRAAIDNMQRFTWRAAAVQIAQYLET